MKYSRMAEEEVEPMKATCSSTPPPALICSQRRLRNSIAPPDASAAEKSTVKLILQSGMVVSKTATKTVQRPLIAIKRETIKIEE